MSEIKSRADLFEAAAKMMHMCDEAGIEQCFKYCGSIRHPHLHSFMESPQDYEFPLAVIEGKPVFKGDELYHSPLGDGHWYKFIVCDFHEGDGAVTPLEQCKWLPPKPRTVMVELLREDAEYIASSSYGAALEQFNRMYEACRKALEEK